MNGKTKSRPPQTRRTENENNVSVSVTVFWLLCAFGSLVAQVTVVALAAFGQVFEVPGQITAVALLIAVVLGGIGVIFTPIAYRFRESRPPASVGRFVAVVGTTAFIVAWWFSS